MGELREAGLNDPLHRPEQRRESKLRVDAVGIIVTDPTGLSIRRALLAM